MMIVTTVIILILLALLRSWLRYLKMKSMLSNMPGQTKSTFMFFNICTMLSLLKEFSNDPSVAFMKIRKMYRDRAVKEGIFCIFSPFGEPLISVYRADLLEEVFKSPDFSEKAHDYELLEPWLGKALLTSGGAQWKAQRKMLTPSFHFRILDEYENTMNEHSLKIIKQMREDTTGKLLKNIELSEWATNCTMEVLLETVMGLEPSQTEASASREYINNLNLTAELFILRNFSFFNNWDFIYYKRSEGKRFLEAVSKLHAFTDKIIQAKIVEFRADPSKLEPKPGQKLAFLDMLVALHLNGNQLSVQEIREQVATFMFAGHDTTGWGIAWMLYQLGLQKEVQAKVHEELDLIFGSDKERPATSDDIKELKYFDCVLKECQRMYGSVPDVSRSCTTDGAQLGPYKIPKEGIIYISIHFLHHDPEVFPDPERFDPDRFLPENSKGRNPYAFIPFSAGPRNCIGQKFALQELKTTLVNVLRNFKVESKKPIDEIDLAGELILRAKNGLHVDFIPRK